MVSKARQDTIAVKHLAKPAQPAWSSLFAFTTGKHKISLLSAMFFSIVVALIAPAFSILLGRIFNQFAAFGAETTSNSTFRSTIVNHSKILAGLGLVAWLLNGCFFLSWLAFGELQGQEVRNRLFHGLASRDCAWFDRQESGRIANLLPRLQTQIRELQIATSQPLGYVVQYAITAILSLGVAFFYCWNLTFVILATLPVSALFLSWMSSLTQSSIEGQTQQLSSASTIVSNAFTHIDIVKYFNGQPMEFEKFSAAINRAASHYSRQARLNALQIGFVRFATLVMFVQGFWYGHHLVSSNSQSTGTVITTFWSCLTATKALEEILPQALVLEKGRAAGAALKNIVFDTKSSQLTKKKPKGLTPSSCAGDIEFKEITFSYPSRPDIAVLSAINCFFAAGEMTFVLGRSGSGKSTISQLLLRFYQPESGQILLDGEPLEKLDTQWLRQSVTLVEQATTMFHGSIFENIVLDNTVQGDLPSHAVKAATDFAQLRQTLLDLPAGLNTILGVNGSGLSGGQGQRVALARARLRDTPILILDESTSALDHLTRSLILTAIRHWRRGKTTIVITHDLSQVLGTDYHYVFQDGKIVEQGFGVPVLPPQVKRDELLHKYPYSNIHTAVKIPQIGSDPVGSSIDERKKVKKRNSFIPAIYQTNTGNIFDGNPTMSKVSTTVLPRTKATFSDGERKMSKTMSDPTTHIEHELFVRYSRRISDTAIELFELAGLKSPEASRKSSNACGKQSRPSSPDEKFTTIDHREKPVTITMKQILSTVWPSLDRSHRLFIIIGAIGAVIHAILTPVFSWVFAKLLQTFYKSADNSKALQYSLSIIVIAAIDAIACFCMHLLLELAGQAWIDATRTRAFKRLLVQPQVFFGKPKTSVSQLTQSLDRDAEEMRNLVGRFAGFVLVAAIMVVLTVVWGLITCWKLTLVGISMAPVSLLITKCFQSVSEEMETACNSASDAAAAILDETFTNFKSVQALTMEIHFRSKHTAAVDTTLKLGLKRAVYCGFFFGISEAIVFFIDALIFYYGAVLTSSHEYSIAAILIVFTMLLFTMANLTAIVAFIPQIEASKATARRLLHFASLCVSSHESTGNMLVPKIKRITLKNLFFDYPDRPDVHVLRDVNAVFTPGSSTAIVGTSGSGKSTIIALLMRMYATPATAVTINGRSLRHFHMASFRAAIGIVPQTPTLFPGSIEENIAYGLAFDSPHRSRAAIEAAASAAGIDTFISSLPRGFDTVLGDGGASLSGGQTQRVAIARALLRQPQVLILDEATSALDGMNAALVMGSIARILQSDRQLTVIIVTHSAEMMRLTDRVIVLEEGTVVEEGRFEVLMARRGNLAKLLVVDQEVGNAPTEPVLVEPELGCKTGWRSTFV